MKWESSCFSPHLDGETRPPEASIDYPKLEHETEYAMGAS